MSVTCKRAATPRRGPTLRMPNQFNPHNPQTVKGWRMPQNYQIIQLFERQAWGCSVVTAPPRVKVVRVLSSILLDVDLLVANQIKTLQALKAGGLAAYQAAIDGVHVNGLTVHSNLVDAISDVDYSRGRS